MQHKQIFSRLITLLVVLTQVLAGVSGALPAQGALAAAAAPSLERTGNLTAASAPAPERAPAAHLEKAVAPAVGPAELARPADLKSSSAAPAAKPLAAGGPASISGWVYSDFNANGVKDTGEVGVGGVTVTAYDATGAAIASTTASTAAATVGQYTLSGLPAGTSLRLEFTTLPAWDQPAPHGSTNSMAVQFVTTTSGTLSNVNFGVNNPVDYSQSNPDVVTPLYVNGDTNTAAPIDALVKFAYNGTFGSPTPTTLATKAQIGSTWGLAYARLTHTIYAAAFLKRHAGLGPDGLGAIYAVNSNGGTPMLFADLATLGANVGTVLSNSARGLGIPTAPSNDPTTFDQIGKVGLGDIAIADDEQTLYVINLNDKTLYALNVPAGTLAGSYAIPDPGCTGGAWRPFALKFKQGALYVGGVCDAQTSQNRADLKANIYRFTPGANTFSQILNFPLNYDKGPVTGPCCGLAFSGWYPWLGTFDTNLINTSVQAGIVAVYPQPMLSDIEFDVDGSLILGFMDRFGHQGGDQNYGTTGATRYDVLVGGDILRACPDAAGNWVLEAGGICGGVTGGGANGQGPGGGEFYNGEYFYSSSAETSMGGLVLKPGSGEVVLTVMDPWAYITGGVSWLSNTTGDANRRYQVYDATRDVHFGKANGLGDLELLADPASIEIGNRVWKDTNNNGIQDVGEPSLADVTVSLYDSNNNRLATVATDAQGAYYFSNAAGVDTFNTKYNLATLKPNTTGYQLRIDTTQPTLKGLGLTNADADSSANGDARDSDAQMSGNNAVITFATGAPGANNQSYDFGFKFTGVGIGNSVWKDNNADGLQDATDTPLVGVTVGLYQSNGNPVLCAQGQSGDYLDTGAGINDSAGTLNWAGQAWTFTGAGATTGGNPGNTVYVYGNGAATRAVDLSVFGAYPVLSYDFAYHYNTDTYSHTVEYSTNSGATWTALANYTDISSATTWQSVSYVLPTLSANARIRIRGGAGGTFNYLGIDNLRIAGSVAAPVTAVTNADGQYGFDSTTCLQPSTQYQVRIATAQTPLTGLYLTAQDAGGVTSNDATLDGLDSDAASVTISNTLYARILVASPITATNASYDFGFMPEEIGSSVWEDTNANGLKASGESGIPRVIVGLYDTGGNPVMCPQVGRYDTYADGFNSGVSNGSTGSLTWGTSWSFAGSAVAAGTLGNPGGSMTVYGATTSTAVRPVDLSVFGGPSTLSFDYIRGNGATSFNVQYSSNGGTSFTTLATLSVNNASYQTITYTLPITVVNARIRLQGATGGALYASFDNFIIRGQQRFPVTAVTDSDGLYTFTGANCVQPSTGYQMSIDTTQAPLMGLFLTTPNTGGVTSNDPTADNSDSDASPVTISGAPTAVIDFISSPGGMNDSYAFGFAPVEIGNTVWKDLNANGVQDSSEPGIPGVTVSLYDASGNAVLCPQTSTVNLALNQTATQSGLFGSGFEASKAVDGNTTSGESITQATANSWWQVDLGQSATLRQVVIYARPDGVGHTQTEQIYVEASNQPFASTALQATLNDPNVWHSAQQMAWTGASLTVAVPSYVGRYVRIQHGNTDYLALGEVQVFGDPNLPVTTVTDATGHYTFTGVDCVQPSTNYQVRIATNQTALLGLNLAPANAGGVTSSDPTGDDTDSDATSVTISNTLYAQIGLTSPAGGANYSYDFGFTPLEIGNYVWKDTDANGRQDSGEPGIPGVTVGLYDSGGNPVMCPQVGRYDTYADGFNSGVSNGSTGSLTWGTSWSFAGSAAAASTLGNPGGSMTVYGATTSTAVRLVDLSVFGGPSTLSFDYIRGNGATSFNVQYSSNGGTSFTTLATLSVNNASYQTITYTLPITVVNARIRLQGATGGALYASFDNFIIRGQQRFPVTAVTDSDGLYYFNVSPHTAYTLTITPPSGYRVTNANVAALGGAGVSSNDAIRDTRDSDAVLVGSKATIYYTTGSAGQNNHSLDFGIFRSTTGKAGITNIAPPVVKLGNRLWIESDNDGDATTGVVVPVVGQVVTATSSSGKVYTTTTDANGFYTITVLANTVYTVQTGIPVGTLPSTVITNGADDANAAANDNKNHLYTTTLVTIAQHDNLSVDFGFWMPQPDILLTKYTNGDDADLPTGPTVAVGSVVTWTYAITNTGNVTLTNIKLEDDQEGSITCPQPQLAPGSAMTCLLTGIAKAGQYANTAVVTGTPTLGSVRPVTSTNPSHYLGLTAGLGDRVWYDVNHNGVQDLGEQGVPSVTVQLLNNSGVAISTTTTSASGYYRFDGLEPGDYFVEFTPPAGYTPSPLNQGNNDALDSDADASTNMRTAVTHLNSGEYDPTWDLGLTLPTKPAAIGDLVWFDANKDGVQNANETGIPGVTVTLYKADGTLVATTTTDANGNYLFQNLAPGSYYVQFTPPAGYKPSPQDKGGNDLTDSDADVTTGRTIVTTLAAGQTDLSWDAGFYLDAVPASIGDYVWYDANLDGIQNAGETGIPGVQVNLYDGAGHLLVTTLTDAAGKYEFKNLTPGSYSLEFIPPAGYEPSPQDKGTDDAIDSDADLITGRTIVTTLDAGEHDMTWDAGFYVPGTEGGVSVPATLGDHVWEDTNKNGIQDITETVGVPGVIVKLYTADGTLRATTVTDANGNYIFINLAPGSYYVVFAPPADYTLSPNSVGDKTLDSDMDVSLGRTPTITLTAGEHNMTIDLGVYKPPTALEPGAEPQFSNRLYLPVVAR